MVPPTGGQRRFPPQRRSELRGRIRCGRRSGAEVRRERSAGRGAGGRTEGLTAGPGSWFRGPGRAAVTAPSLRSMQPVGVCTASLGSLGLMRFFGVPWAWSLAAALGIGLGSGGWRLLRVICKTALRDLL